MFDFHVNIQNIFNLLNIVNLIIMQLKRFNNYMLFQK